MQFFLGTHQVDWLAKTNAPLFVSARRLRLRKSLPRALGTWALDSGGFSELQLFGEWRTDAAAYASEVRRWRDEIGGMSWAAPQDWMCEPIILAGGRAGGVVFAGTKCTVAEHQRATVANYRLLRQLAPDLPWMPVLQGWAREDYLRCIDLYAAAGIDLAREPLVGLGTMCRRQNTNEAEDIIRELAGAGLRLHGFGLKTEGLKRASNLLASADSLAWSDAARRRWLVMPGCRHGRYEYRKRLGREEWGACGNCIRWALAWRGRVMSASATPKQLRLF